MVLRVRMLQLQVFSSSVAMRLPALRQSTRVIGTNSTAVAELERGRVVTVEDRLANIENLLLVLVEREQRKEWYEVEEFARLTSKAAFTVREWCRLGRIRAEKRRSGRGAYPQWVISHAELERYRREGLLIHRRDGR